ncbi:MAG: DUF4174 domain-containing protein [Chthoniobacterales bacterium]
MKIISLLLISLACLSAQAAPLKLADLRWKRRVLVVYAPPGSEGKLLQQQKLLRAAKAGFDDRDVTLLILRRPAENAEIAQRFNLAGSEFSVVLIGKDGGEKFRVKNVARPGVLFQLIDSMPLRGDEKKGR